MFLEHFKIIMEGFDCDFNTAMQLSARGTVWEDQMISEYEVTLVAEITTTVTLVAETEEDAFDSAYDGLIQQVKHETNIETIEIIDYEVKRNLNKIH